MSRCPGQFTKDVNLSRQNGQSPKGTTYNCSLATPTCTKETITMETDKNICSLKSSKYNMNIIFWCLAIDILVLRDTKSYRDRRISMSFTSFYNLW